MVSLKFPLVFSWFSQGFPIAFSVPPRRTPRAARRILWFFLWFSYGFRLVSQRFSDGFSHGFLCLSVAHAARGARRVPQFSDRVPLVFLWFPMEHVRTTLSARHVHPFQKRMCIPLPEGVRTPLAEGVHTPIPEEVRTLLPESVCKPLPEGVCTPLPGGVLPESAENLWSSPVPGFPWFSFSFHVVFLCFPSKVPSFPMVFSVSPRRTPRTACGAWFSSGFPMVCLWFSVGFQMIFSDSLCRTPCAARGASSGFPAVPTVFGWFSYGFPFVFRCFVLSRQAAHRARCAAHAMVFLRFSFGYRMVFPWFSHGFPLVFRWLLC